MSWDFETDPEYAAKLDWADQLVRAEVEPLDLVLGDPFDKTDLTAEAAVAPLCRAVRGAGLWAAHLEPELGGQGYGQLKLALLNEVIGRSRWAPSVFGCQAPDSGNAEILARYGTPEQRERYLQPLLDGRIASCYAMTEPHAGSDPTLFRTRAVRDGGGWRISGEKWFATNARHAEFLIVVAVTDPDVEAYRGQSMFLVPRGAPGLEIVRDVAVGGEPAGTGTHAYLRFTDVAVAAEQILGAEGEAFAIGQTRLGGGRIHHAMRTIAQVRKAFDLMCERALSRETRSGPLGRLGVVQEQIADSWLQIEQFRLLVLRTAWLIDRHRDYRKVRKDISAVKAAMPVVYSDVARRALHLHGALGVSEEMPFAAMLVDAEVMGLADGPTEVHKSVLARDVLKEHRPSTGDVPSGHLPTRRAAARRQLAARLEREVAEL